MRGMDSPETRPRSGSIRAFAILASALLPLAWAGAQIPDTDGDGVVDNIDNCVTFANAGQQDTDSDGIGNRCDADITNDGQVNFGDLAAFKSAFIPRPYDPDADFNSDGFVNFADLAIFVPLFNMQPGPAGYAQWVTDADGDWGERLNWFPAVVPPAEAYVTIDVPSAITVTVDDNESFAATQVDSEERIVVDGTLAVSGTLLVNDELVLANGGRLEDATLLPAGSPLETLPSTSFSFDNITLATDFTVRNASNLNLYTGLTLSGTTFTMASTGNNTSVIGHGDMTFGGTGTIEFGGSTGSNTVNRFYQQLTTGETLSFGPGIAFETVTTGGRIGLANSGRSIDVQGPVNSDLSGRVVRLEGDPLDFRGDLLEASNGGGYYFDGTWINDETMTLADSDLEFNGTWANTGQINVTGTPVELDGMTTSTGLGVITSDGEVLLTATVDNTSQTMDVDNLPAGLIFTSTGRINGGTISGAAGLKTANGITVNLDGVTMATDFTLNNASTLNLYNGMELSGTFTFASMGNNTSLIAQGGQFISGTGTMLFGGMTGSDTVNRMYQQTAGQTLTLGPMLTVESDTTGGRIGLETGSRGMEILGTVKSTISGRQVRIEGQPLSFDADKLLSTNGGGFYISGDFTIQSGDTLAVTGGEVDLKGDWINEGTVVVTDGDLNLEGFWDNDGTITANNSLGELDGDLATADFGTINSDGQVLLTATVDNTSDVLDLDDLPAGLVFANTGRINGGIVAGSSALVTATSATLYLDDVTFETDFVLNNASVVNLYTGLKLTGTRFTLASIGNNTSVVAQGGLTVDGPGTIEFAGSTNSDTVNRLYQQTAGQTLVFGPTIAFETVSTGGRIGLETGLRGLDIQGPVNSDLTDRFVRIEGEPANFRGDLLTASDGGKYYFGGAWANDEIITLSNSNVVFEGDWSNSSGQVNLINSPLELDGETTTAGLGVITSDSDVLLTGTVDNTGATLNVDTLPAGLIFTTGGRINGGTITGMAGLETANSVTVNLDDVTMATDFTLNNAATLNLYNGMTLSGTFTFASDGNNTTLIAQGGQTIGGTGTIVFGGTTGGDTTNRMYQGSAGQTLTLASTLTVESDTSAGSLGWPGARGMAVLCDVISDVSGRQVYLQGAPLSFDADRLFATGGGGFHINGDWTLQFGDTLTVNGGEVDLIGGTWENAGAIEVENGDLNLDGTWSNTGSIDLINTPLELDGNVTTAGLGTINSDSTVTLTATLDNAGSTLNTDALPTGFSLGGSAYIDGGNISGSAGLTVNNSSIVDLDGVTLGTDLTVGNAAWVELSSVTPSRSTMLLLFTVRPADPLMLPPSM